jgi:RNA polymerase sigma-70 factor, ECF subfamily
VNTNSDIELVISLRNGEISAGGVLYERYKRHIYNFVVGMLLDEQSAQDIVQQTFVIMIEKIGMLNNDITIKQWLFTIARNESLMILRRRKAIPMDGIEAAEEMFLDSDSPDSALLKNETFGMVHNALNRLTSEYREIILLQMNEQLSYEEIALITNTTVGSVRSKLYKAKIALVTLLSPDFKRED